MRIGVHVLFCAEHASILLHFQAEMKVQCLRLGSGIFIVLAIHCELRVIGILHPTACITLVERGIDILFVPSLIQFFGQPVFACEVHHRTRSLFFGLHIQSGYTGSIRHFLVVRTKGGSDMDDTCTVFGGDIVTGDDTEGSFSGIHPREELVVMQPDKFLSFATPDDNRLKLVAIDIRGTEFFLISIQTCLGKNDAISVLLHFHIINLRSYTKGGIGWERPRCSGPSYDIAIGAGDTETDRASEVFHVTITTGLVEFVTAQSRSCSRRIRLNGITFVQIAFLVQFTQ